MNAPPDGILNLDKPQGISSARALYRVRGILGQRKSGHAGTLDPAAAGVLLICLGRATRLVERIMDLPKVYRAAARLDVTSESFDSDRALEPVTCGQVPTPDEIGNALRELEGNTLQTPPAISAVKVGGVPAYRRFHSGRPLELAPRPVMIHWIAVRHFSWPLLEFDMACGRGTYVRAMIRDLGLRLRTGGCLTALSRLSVGPFTLADSCSLEDLRRHIEPAGRVIPLETAREMIEKGIATIPPRPEVICTEKGGFLG
jgi:tRNA pseudouridine55 synthase